jgi:hypothetical protein
MGVSVVAIMICCGCGYRKRRERRDAEELGNAENRTCVACACCCDGERYIGVKMALKLLGCSALLVLVVQDLNRPMVDRIGEYVSPDFMRSEGSGAGESGESSGPGQHHGAGLLQFLLLVSIGACVLGGCKKLWQCLTVAMCSGTSRGGEEPVVRICGVPVLRGAVRTDGGGELSSAHPHQQLPTSTPE